MTITPELMSKKDPVEKHMPSYGVVDIQTDGSKLAPVWMVEQTKAGHKDGHQQYKLQPISEKKLPALRN